MSQLYPSEATCFGKIPSRGDFVKGGGPHLLINSLDEWASRAMDQLSEDPRWKATYDAACAIDFGLVGARSRISVVGHLRPSVDSSGRRFPFITAAAVERDDALMFRCAPAGLHASFAAFARISAAGTGGADVTSLFADLARVDCASDFEEAVRGDPLGNFVRHTSLSSLGEMPGLGGSDTLRRVILAIGLLLQPMVGQAGVSINKELELPLASDERRRNLVAGLWLYLVTAFLRKTAVEIQFVIERRPDRPRMLIGFNGVASDTLRVAMSAGESAEAVISLRNPQWVDEHPSLLGDYGVAKLASYLAQPSISLELVVNTFREVFLGE